MTRGARWLVAAIVVGAAMQLVAGLTADGPNVLWAHDIYAQYYPSLLYALHALREGGRGLLWNPFQNCGQPFFGISLNGLLYPTNAFYLVLSGDTALRATVFANLVVGGLAAYALARELGVGHVAAVGGALAFELGNASLQLASWCPYALEPFVWWPAALLFTERILRAPTVGGAVGLGIVLALALFAGFPQTVFFVYQLIALRAAWELVSGRLGWRAAGMIVLALALGPLLAAVQLVPALEVARASMRNARLTLDEISPGGVLDWRLFRHAMAWRDVVHDPLSVVPCVVAGIAVFHPRTRRHAIFWVLVGVAYFFLAFPKLPLFRLYMRLPIGSLFREPARFLWVPSFAQAMLTALALEALAGPRRGWFRVAAVGAPLIALLALQLLAPLRRVEALAAALGVAGCAIAALAPRRARWAAVGVLGALVVNLVWAPPTTWMRLLPTDASLFAHADLFAALRARMSAQDRLLIIHGLANNSRYALMAKDPSLFRVRSIQDYELQISRRYAEYFVMMQTGRAMRNVNEAGYGWNPVHVARRLLDLSAARYLVVERGAERGLAGIEPPPRLVEERDDVLVYENPQAFPRAFWVPRVEPVGNAALLLDRLAHGRDDLREVALVESVPPSGFTGAAGKPPGDALEFVRDDPEDVVLRVRAPERGFVFLADQGFPGWHARVDGRPEPILRANHVFRLVEVPRGESTVEFVYAPASVRIGAAVSGVTLLALAALGLSRRGRGN